MTQQHLMTQHQLAGKVKRLCRELDVLYRSELAWKSEAINRVSGELAEAEFALAEAMSKHVEAIGSD